MVSRGAQKNFAEFTLQLEKALVPDILYFQEMVAKAIMFRAAERIVSSQDFGGYRANIVTYTLAWIAHHSGGGVDHPWRSIARRFSICSIEMAVDEQSEATLLTVFEQCTW